ncbi:hypothetical protein Taro_035537 [Colocasia esculenta]|uniref:Uncharacterized protein n=1 Tax=Colocasia esculenta TaxID=4460 RepID=A0A843VZ85_COLES|nr:hypothetical protein [Colocasia esculenta]
MGIFEPFRALGYITAGVPFSVQRRGTETFVTVSVGKAWQIYDCAKLTLVLVDRDMHLPPCLAELRAKKHLKARNIDEIKQLLLFRLSRAQASLAREARFCSPAPQHLPGRRYLSFHCSFLDRLCLIDWCLSSFPPSPPAKPPPPSPRRCAPPESEIENRLPGYDSPHPPFLITEIGFSFSSRRRRTFVSSSTPFAPNNIILVRRHLLDTPMKEEDARDRGEERSATANASREQSLLLGRPRWRICLLLSPTVVLSRRY